jgi:hypothetical protein
MANLKETGSDLTLHTVYIGNHSVNIQDIRIVGSDPYAWDNLFSRLFLKKSFHRFVRL